MYVQVKFSVIPNWERADYRSYAWIPFLTIILLLIIIINNFYNFIIILTD